MDHRLEKALELASSLSMFNDQKSLLFNKLQDQSVYYYNGGKFTVTKNLINFCFTLISNNQTSAVIVDDNNIPIKIEILEEFYHNLLNVYSTATNEYYNDYQSLIKKRTKERLMDIDTNE